ncbi:unnamed protein product [marine sediment metagenome]|uniref:Uncharacterized protein n=1 Tax=marine sediment metagenome TaxID=412755 RepID=X1HLC1_9ZZZZ
MTYELVYTRRAARDLDKLDQETLHASVTVWNAIGSIHINLPPN